MGTDLNDTIATQTGDLADYRSFASDSTVWLQAGKRLLATADLLWVSIAEKFERLNAISESIQAGREVVDDDLETWELTEAPAFRLLAGYAIENFIKAVHVRKASLRGEAITTADGELVGLRQDHDLEQLARQVLGDSTLSGSELFFLKILTLAVRWAGRYPTGIKRPSRIDFMRASGTGSADSKQVHELADRILQIHDSLK